MSESAKPLDACCEWCGAFLYGDATHEECSSGLLRSRVAAHLATIDALRAERNEVLRELVADGAKNARCATCDKPVSLWRFKWLDCLNGFECFGCRKVFCVNCAGGHFGPVADARAEAAESALEEARGLSTRTSLFLAKVRDRLESNPSLEDILQITKDIDAFLGAPEVEKGGE